MGAGGGGMGGRGEELGWGGVTFDILAYNIDCYGWPPSLFSRRHEA